jgi:hypothetical protein
MLEICTVKSIASSHTSYFIEGLIVSAQPSYHGLVLLNSTSTIIIQFVTLFPKDKETLKKEMIKFTAWALVLP